MVAISAKSKWSYRAYAISGLCYKNITIINDTSRVFRMMIISDGTWHNIERHLWSSIMLLELSIMLLENLYSAGREVLLRGKARYS